MIYFYGDPHFWDANVILFDNRPFNDISEMDKKLIEWYNEIITDEDEVYFTGDFGAKDVEQQVLDSLKGKKYLIKGNHDTKSNEEYRKAGFVEVYDHPIILDDFYIVSHEPIYVSESMPYANIFAHVHSNPTYRTCSSRSYCTCVDRNGFKPVSFEFIKDEIQRHARKFRVGL